MTIFTSIRRYFINSAIHRGHTLYPQDVSIQACRLDSSSFIKFGSSIDVHEAESIKYVAAHTSVPVPAIKDVWRRNGCTYILMEYIAGVDLDVAWAKMSEETKDFVVQQLNKYVTELRSIPCPLADGAVCSVTGGYLRDNGRLGLIPFGPFHSCEEFHSYLRGNTALDVVRTVIDGGQEVYAFHSRSFTTTKFTHGDLAPRNIRVDNATSGRIVAILDWDAAGWYPDYWEYSKAKWASRLSRDWESRIPQFAGDYEAECIGDRHVAYLCGDFLGDPAHYK